MAGRVSQLAKAAVNKMIKLTVNGSTVQVPQGSTLLAAIQKSRVHIPTLCYHPEFKSRAVCRLCLVEIAGYSKPVPACYTPAEEGLIVTTHSPDLKAYRQRDLEFLLSRHPNECIRCEAAGDCKLQDLVQEEQVADVWPKSTRGSPKHPEHRLHDHTSPSIFRDIDKCINCGLCVDACAAQRIDAIGFAERGAGRVNVTAFDTPLAETGCISCGQCTLRCPVGALIERPDWHRVLEVLDSKKRKTVVQTAPATRIAIGEEFDLEPGTVSTGRLVHALRALGFDYVTDTNFSADLTIMEEANELVARVKGEREGKLPLFTSCCPGWVNYIEIHRPDLLPHLSTTKSPQQMHGAVLKRGPFARAMGLTEDPYVVSIMPCTAKKDEAERPGMSGDVDAVITTRELARMLRHRKIPFASLATDGTFDSPCGESSGAGAIFGASGGVLEAALRTVAHILNLDNHPLEVKQVRGVKRGVKIAAIEGVGSVAAVSSIGSAVELLEDDAWKDFLMIEVMACPGGCLGGGGEPKSDDPNILEKRAKGIYKIDADAPIRESHGNTEVQQLYDEWLGHPLSEKSEEMLHTTFLPRRSPREKLAMFLEAVDHRNGAKAAELFSDTGVWQMNQPNLVEVRGKAQIENFVSSKLPPQPLRHAEHSRHRLASPLEGTEVIMPTGQRVHFDVDLDQDTGLINNLTRIAQ